MKGFKNFFHETNDIALAILIVLVAASLITWRLRIILQYPAEMARSAAGTGTQTEQSADADAKDAK